MTWLDDYLLRQQVVVAGFTLDGASPALQVGDWFCVAPTDTTGSVVTKALPAALAIAGAPLAIAVESAQPGQPVRGIVVGMVPPIVTGLGLGSTGPVSVSVTARTVRVGDPTKVVGLTDTNGTVTLGVHFEAAGGGGGSGVPGGLTGELQYNNAGAFAGVGVVRSAAGDLGFGVTVATSGKLRFGAGAAVAPVLILYGLKADGVTTVPLIRWGAGANERFTIGDVSTGPIASFHVGGYFFGLTHDANQFDVSLGGGVKLSLTNTTLDCKGNALTNVASVAAPTLPATIGMLRGSKNSVLVAGRNDDNTGDGRIITLGTVGGTGGANVLTFGGSGFGHFVALRYDVSSSGVHTFQVNTVPVFEVSATAIDCKTTPLTNVTTINGARFIAPTQGANLTDANQTIAVSGGANYFMPAATTTAVRVKTIGNTGAGAGAADKAIVSVTLMTQGHDVTFNNNSGTGLLTVPASSSARVLDFQYDHATTNYVYRGWKPVQ